MTFAKSITFLLVVLISISTFGQSPKKQKIINDALKKESIKTQLEILIEKSPNYQNYKTIKLLNLNKFKSNFNDSLKAFDKKYELANVKINEQDKKIVELNSKIEAVNTNLTSVTKEKDSISLFGLQMTKSAYNLILWSLILSFLATTLVFVFKYISSNKQTKKTKISFNDIESEFEIHKKKSLEREQVLRRKLQDEINKQRNI